MRKTTVRLPDLLLPVLSTTLMWARLLFAFTFATAIVASTSQRDGHLSASCRIPLVLEIFLCLRPQICPSCPMTRHNLNQPRLVVLHHPAIVHSLYLQTRNC